MRQTALLPSGCQLRGFNILGSSENSLFYASTLAVYMLDAKTFIIKKILSSGDKSIASLTVSPHNNDLIAISTIDGIMRAWDTEEETVIGRSELNASASVYLEWDPHNKDSCLALVCAPAVQVFSWDVRKISGERTTLFSLAQNPLTKKVEGTCGRWNPHKPGQVAIGCSNGSVIVFDANAKSKLLLQVAQRESSIADLAWDRLSSIYLLVAYQHFISLWDSQNCCEVQIFEKQGMNITNIAWLDWTAGNFISSNRNTGVMKVWNASQKHPIETFRVSSDGISQCLMIPGSKRLMCASIEGQISVYHVGNRQTEFSLPTSHTETIFDCIFSRNNPNIFASSSYDGCVKIWNAQNLSLLKSLYTSDSIVYKIEWNHDDRVIIGSTFRGTVVLWETKTGREIAKYAHHSRPSYSVSWNRLDTSLICSGGGDGYLIVALVNVDKLLDMNSTSLGRGSRQEISSPISESNIVAKISHPKAVYGCAWCPHVLNLVVTCCHDKKVRIFAYDKVSSEPLVILSGHSQRVFHCFWSPLVPGLLASGSDDKSIKIWKVKDIAELSKTTGNQSPKPNVSLIGHSSFVRALCWNTEISDLLISGSWDSTIRVWNVVTGYCLRVVECHVADVYALSTHPERPFVYASCSRDTSIRIWELEDFADMIRLRLVCGKTLDTDNHVENGEEALETHSKSALLGQSSARLAKCLNDISNKTLQGEKLCLLYAGIYDFLTVGGISELWAIASQVLREKFQSDNDESTLNYTRPPNQTTRAIINESKVISEARSDAKKLEASKMTSRKADIAGKTADNLLEAALIHCKAGDMRSYCNIMIELGNWKEALALAPAVSLSFWKEICKKYSERLVSSGDDACTPYLLASGRGKSAAEFYVARKDFKSAMIIAKTTEQDDTCFPLTSDGAQSTGWVANNHSLEESKVRDSTSKHGRELIHFVSIHSANQQLQKGSVRLAAAQLLSTGDFEGAVQMLSRFGQIDCAFALAMCFDMDCGSFIVALANDLASRGDMNLALDILSKYTGSMIQKDIEQGLLVTRHCTDDSVAETYLSKVSKGASWWCNKAREEEEIGSDQKCITFFLIGRDQSSAVTLGISLLAKGVRQPHDALNHKERWIHAIQHVHADKLPSTQRIPFLCFMLWYSAHAAAQVGNWEIGASLLKVLGDHVASCNFPLSVLEIKSQEIFFRIAQGDRTTLSHILALEHVNAMGASALEMFTDLRELILKVNSDRSHAIATDDNYDFHEALQPHSVLIWKSMSEPIFREINRLGNAMSLPSLEQFLPVLSKGSQSEWRSPGTSKVSLFGGEHIGNSLPMARSKHHNISCITGKNVRKRAIQLDTVARDGDGDDSSPKYVAAEEFFYWRQFNPFCPTMSGRFMKSI
jgi:WD40 repeat protein